MESTGGQALSLDLHQTSCHLQQLKLVENQEQVVTVHNGSLGQLIRKG